ncbi:hypothetical protein ABPG75_005750 [Micractinium tetrahymenae]
MPIIDCSLASGRGLSEGQRRCSHYASEQQGRCDSSTQIELALKLLMAPLVRVLGPAAAAGASSSDSESSTAHCTRKDENKQRVGCGHCNTKWRRECQCCLLRRSAKAWVQVLQAHLPKAACLSDRRLAAMPHAAVQHMAGAARQRTLSSCQAMYMAVLALRLLVGRMRRSPAEKPSTSSPSSPASSTICTREEHSGVGCPTWEGDEQGRRHGGGTSAGCTALSSHSAASKQSSRLSCSSAQAKAASPQWQP